MYTIKIKEKREKNKYINSHALGNSYKSNK